MSDNEMQTIKRDTDNEVMEHQPKDLTQPVQIQDNGVSPLVQMFATGNFTVEQLRAFQEFQREHEKDLALKAYNIAMAKARAEMGAAIKTNANDFVGSMYADLSDLIRAAGPPLSDNGFNWSWKIFHPEQGFLLCNCLITHNQGHTETYPCRMPDAITIMSKTGKPVNNPAQAAGSARTYAKRYSFMEAIGLATEDDDGNAAGAAPVVDYIDDSDIADIEAVITELGGSMEKWKNYQIKLKGSLPGNIPKIPKSAKARAIENIRLSDRKRKQEEK